MSGDPSADNGHPTDVQPNRASGADGDSLKHGPMAAAWEDDIKLITKETRSSWFKIMAAVRCEC